MFQGLQLHEAKYLDVSDVDLKQMTITIPNTNKSNTRKLAIDVKQVLLLNQYLTLIRKVIVSNRKEHSKKLIVTSKDKNCIRSIELNKKLRKLTNQPNLRLIRTSVIRYWLLTQDLRTVQYKAGHRYISSTERYIVKDIEQLKKNVLLYHPL